MEFVENREVEQEQLKAIFRDMVKYLSNTVYILCQSQFFHSSVLYFRIGLDFPV